MRFSKIFLWFSALSVCFLVSFVPEARACKVPVFRYALEHWYPDPYQAVILHRGAIPDEAEPLVAKLEEMATDPNRFANLEVKRLDVEQEHEAKMLTGLLGPEYRDHIQSPEIALLYPRSSQSGPLAWQGALTPENIDALVDSPARRQITDWVLAGESAVWVLIGVGDAKKDKAAEDMLRKELALLENELELRDIEIIEAESQFGQDTNVELRLGLKLLVLDRNDPKEKIFATTLLRSDADIEKLGEPVAIPVFGRGRAFLPLAGSGINAENIEESCRFLIGDCSCEVKRFNPGVDLLFDINWDDLVVGSAGVDPSLPDLSGIGLYAEISLDEPESESFSDAAPSHNAPEAEGIEANSQIDSQSPGPDDTIVSEGAPIDEASAELQLANSHSSKLSSEAAQEQSQQSESQRVEDDNSLSSTSFGQRLTLSFVALIAVGVVLVGITAARLRSQANHQ